MNKAPWAKFYYSDWRSDPRLRMCGLTARGLWIELLALMHEAEPHGHLLVHGRAPTDTQLAVLTGSSPDQIPGLLGELESAGVFSRTQKGVIYSRRMTRDFKKAQIARQNGKSGGNPKLSNKRQIPPSDKGQDNGMDKGDDNTQMPDARDLEESVSNETARKASDPKSIEAEFFAEIKRLCGDTAGGLGVRLSRHFGGDFERCFLVLDAAATKQDPREYLGGVLRGNGVNASASNWDTRKTAVDSRYGIVRCR